VYSDLAEKMQHIAKFATIDCQAKAMAKVCRQEAIDGR
jgi:hypothetical protein